MKRAIAWGMAAVVLLAVVLLTGLSGDSQGVFYRVLGGRNEMVILGSIHAGSREMYPMSQAIRQALRNADVLVFECDTQSTEAIAASQRLMYYPQGETLADHISPECFDRVQAALPGAERMKPWAAVSLLALQNMADEAGASADLGVEAQVRRLGGSKPRKYLETAEEQLLIMDGFSPELQEYLLWDAIDPAADEDLQHWPGWWARGDAEAFARSYREDLAQEARPDLAQEYHASLITARNHRMAQRLAQMLEDGQSKSYFVTVGLMHLVLGEDSVLRVLEKLGYTIEKITQ